MNQEKINKFHTEAINKMLEISGYNKTKEDIIKENNPNWFEDYTITTDQDIKWKEWFIKTCKKKLNLNDRRANKEFMWFRLHHGLKIQD